MEKGLKVRNMVDLVTHWNLTWRDHQRELLRQLRSEPARILWLDPPRASADMGNAKDRELARFIVEIVQTQLDLGSYVAVDATAGGHMEAAGVRGRGKAPESEAQSVLVV